MSIGGQEKRKDSKSQQSRSEKKILFLAKNQEAVTQGESRGIYHPMWRCTQGAGIIKCCKTSETAGVFQIHSHKA